MSSLRDLYVHWDFALQRSRSHGAFKTGLLCKPISGRDESINSWNLLQCCFYTAIVILTRMIFKKKATKSLIISISKDKSFSEWNKLQKKLYS